MAREELSERLEALAALLQARELLPRRAQPRVRLLLLVCLLEQLRHPPAQVLSTLPDWLDLLLDRLEHPLPLISQVQNETMCPLLLFTRQIPQLATLKNLVELGA